MHIYTLTIVKALMKTALCCMSSKDYGKSGGELHALAIVSTRVSLNEPSHPFTSFIQKSLLPSTPSGVDGRVRQNQLLLPFRSQTSSDLDLSQV